ncbi:hypothetical protein IE81DRAFT_350724 [Ceraceosorus guamensis]|uniref:Redoxin domain-containing protein n=1 Tax=Ceraceosorus guamensis TaxID=1522189 RepID=A0A316VML3_9BASI|nr:hypothetical protein IE81DRAFT_350724 [Ceraceosorus guamensis]PWN38822.1 hypothetical protein IE81DRAFT_350724 [Ceraceosorus guamensis]
MSSHMTFPSDLPVPKDDHKASHLMGHPLPFLPSGLQSTSATTTTSSSTQSPSSVDLFQASLRNPVLLFIYPKTGQPGKNVPAEWDAIPGARGCTPHLCSVKDSIDALKMAEPDLQTNSTRMRQHFRIHTSPIEAP